MFYISYSSEVWFFLESEGAVGQGSAVEAVPGLNSELAVHCDTEKLSQRDTEK